MNRYPKSKKKARKIQCADPKLVKEYIFLVRKERKKKKEGILESGFDFRS